MFKNLLKRNFNVSIADVKTLRAMTGAPLSACKQALTETDSDFKKAKALLRERDLLFANKKEGKESNEGLWGFISTENRERGILVNLTCQTDFVAKSQQFVDFFESSLTNLLRIQEKLDITKENDSTKALLDKLSFNDENSFLEAKKMLIAKTEENIEFSTIKTITTQTNSLIGYYVHKTLKKNIGTGGSFVEIDTQGKKESVFVNLADNLAVHCFGMKPKFIYENEMDKTVYEQSLKEIKESMASSLEGKSEMIQKQILKGKFSKFLQDQEVMEYQTLGFMESSDLIGDYIQQFDKKNKSKIIIKSFHNF